MTEPQSGCARLGMELVGQISQQARGAVGMKLMNEHRAPRPNGRKSHLLHDKGKKPTTHRPGSRPGRNPGQIQTMNMLPEVHSRRQERQIECRRRLECFRGPGVGRCRKSVCSTPKRTETQRGLNILPMRQSRRRSGAAEVSLERRLVPNSTVSTTTVGVLSWRT